MDEVGSGRTVGRGSGKGREGVRVGWMLGMDRVGIVPCLSLMEIKDLSGDCRVLMDGIGSGSGRRVGTIIVCIKHCHL